jgi:hypothetical protein
MSAPRTRRDFLADVGRGMLVATVGYEVSRELGFGSVLAEESEALTFGAMEPLVCLMQETPANKLMGALVEKLQSGTEIKQLVSAAALANARTFGGEDYVGFHTMMALSPAYAMSLELPKELQPLPVLKVLYRNTNRIQEHGGKKSEVLHRVKAAELGTDRAAHEILHEQVRSKDVNAAEQTLAAIAARSPDEAFDQLLYTVQDRTEVHRVVMPYRAWDLLNILGKEQAHTMLRQSVRYCVQAESWPRNAKSDDPRTLLPKLLDEHKLMGKTPGDRSADDAWVDQLSQLIFKSTPEQAAGAVAAALAEGFSSAAIGEAVTLAANQLTLRDMGRRPTEEIAGKPIGSVHGDSIGVHATDSANAWRNISRVTGARNCFASLILGAYQVALDRVQRGGDFLNWQPLPVTRHVEQTRASEPEALLRDAEEAIRGNLQARASAIVHRYGELGHAPKPVFDLMLKYAISEDGALHAEKFYRTCAEEFANTRAAFRWRHVVALARVTASEYGRAAAGVAEARTLLKV